MSSINKTKSPQRPRGIFVKTDEGVLRKKPQNFQNQRKYERAQTDAPTRWGYFIAIRKKRTHIFTEPNLDSAPQIYLSKRTRGFFKKHPKTFIKKENK